MLASITPRTTALLAGRVAARRATPKTTAARHHPSSTRSYATEKGPAGVPISGGGGDNNTLMYAAVGLGSAGLIFWYFSGTQQAQKAGASAGGAGVAGLGHHPSVTNEKQNAIGSRLAPGAQEEDKAVKDKLK